MGRDTEGWLSLGRQVGDCVYVDGPCLIRVSEIGGGKTRLAFHAPPTTKVLRTELLTNAARRAIGDEPYQPPLRGGTLAGSHVRVPGFVPVVGGTAGKGRGEA